MRKAIALLIMFLSIVIGIIFSFLWHKYQKILILQGVDNALFFKGKRLTKEDNFFKNIKREDVSYVQLLQILVFGDIANVSMKNHCEIFDFIRKDQDLFLIETCTKADGVVYFLMDQNNHFTIEKNIVLRLGEKHNYGVPRLVAFSPNHKSVLLNMYGCWGCEGHTPHIAIYINKGLQQINYGFSPQWVNNTSIRYKPEVLEQCKMQFFAERLCPKDPNTLDWLYLYL